MPYARRRTTRKTYKKKAPYKGKKFTRGVTNVIHKKLPTNEVRYEQSARLIGFENPVDSFAIKDISSLSNGTFLNQKYTRRVYVSGMRLSLSVINRTRSGTTPADKPVSKQFRFMVVQNKNPADTLDTLTFKDIYEKSTFFKRTPDALQGDMVAPINRDVVRIICDKKMLVRPGDESAVIRNWWIPIKRYWTFKTIADEFKCSSGKTFIVVQATDFSATEPEGIDVQWFARVFYKCVDNQTS